MDLLAYFRMFRRHWILLVVCVVVGTALGAATALLGPGGSAEASAKARYYKATNTLIFKNFNGASTYPSSFGNLEQVALLATTGPVPEAVARQLGGSSTGPQVAERITTLTGASSGTVAITAIGRQPDETATLADRVAEELMADVQASDLDSYNQAKADAEKQVSAIQDKIDALKGQLAAVPRPADADVLEQQLAALEDQYAQEFGNYQSVVGKDPPANPLRSLQRAAAVPIEASEYDTRLAQGRLGQNNLQVGGNQPVATTGPSPGSSIAGPIPRGVFGAFLGLLLGIGVVMLRERLDRRVRTRDDAERAYRAPVLAEPPPCSALPAGGHSVISHDRPMSPVAEAYRAVRSSVLFQIAAQRAADAADLARHGEVGTGIFEPARRDSIVIMVTSAVAAEGKTTSSANLATVCAQAGSRVLVLNCDFRRPMIHEYFGIADRPRRVQETSVPGVSVVTDVVRDVDPNPARVVATQRQVVAAARDRFDVVILDTAPILCANDAIDLVGDVDAVVVVARAGVTETPAAQRAAETLRRVEAPVAGVVLLGSAESQNSYATYYGAGDDAARERKSAAITKPARGSRSTSPAPLSTADTRQNVPHSREKVPL